MRVWDVPILRWGLWTTRTEPITETTTQTYWPAHINGLATRAKKNFSDREDKPDPQRTHTRATEKTELSHREDRAEQIAQATEKRDPSKRKTDPSGSLRSKPTGDLQSVAMGGEAVGAAVSFLDRVRVEWNWRLHCAVEVIQFLQQIPFFFWCFGGNFGGKWCKCLRGNFGGKWKPWILDRNFKSQRFKS